MTHPDPEYDPDDVAAVEALLDQMPDESAARASASAMRISLMPPFYALPFGVSKGRLVRVVSYHMKPKPITYLLIVQCIRPEIGIMAEYIASTPFPDFQAGGDLELLDCDPKTWDVTHASHRIATDKDGGVVCVTLLLADSPVVENRGFVVRKQSGDEVGPSESRFRRLST